MSHSLIYSLSLSTRPDVPNNNGQGNADPNSIKKNKSGQVLFHRGPDQQGRGSKGKEMEIP